MPLANYSQLIASIGDWQNRRDLTNTVIPDVIAMVEARLNRELRIRQMLVRDVIVPPSTDEAYENLPADFLELKSIRFNVSPEIRPEWTTQQRMEDLRAKYMNSGGTPRYYTIVANQILFERVATGSPECEIASYVKVPALNNTTQTSNAILELYPDLYLFGALSQLCSYLDDDRRLQTWEAKYGNALDMAHAADKNAEQGPGPLIMRPMRHF